MQRLAVIAKLRPGTSEEAANLVELGPPFDPGQYGIERHSVFLAADLVVFIFEGGQPNSLLAALGSADNSPCWPRGAASRQYAVDRPRGVPLGQPRRAEV